MAGSSDAQKRVSAVWPARGRRHTSLAVLRRHTPVASPKHGIHPSGDRPGRCGSKHPSEFLQRIVQCKLAVDHPGAHVYTVFDEAVVWDR